MTTILDALAGVALGATYIAVGMYGIKKLREAFRSGQNVWNTPIYKLTTRQLEELRSRCLQEEYDYILFLYSAVKARPALTVKEALLRLHSNN